MRITPSANVLEHAVVQEGVSLAWPAAITDWASALTQHSEIPRQELDDVLMDMLPLVSTLQRSTRLERQLRGMPPNPKTIFLVTILRSIYFSSMPEFSIWEFADVVRPWHPLTLVNPLAHWLPKNAKATFLLLSFVSDFRSLPADTERSESPAADTDSEGSRGLLSSSHKARSLTPSSTHSQANEDQTNEDHTNEDQMNEDQTNSPSLSPLTPLSPQHLSCPSPHSQSSNSPKSLSHRDSDKEDDLSPEEDNNSDPSTGGESVDDAAASRLADANSISPCSDDPSQDDPMSDMIALALQAHMLSHPKEISEPLLGLFCMADIDNVFDVVASALHQRRAWGIISEPVVGLAFDPLDTVVQVVFGWFDDADAAGSYCLPVPRVAYAAPGCTVREQGGIFDLADPDSAEALAIFLLSLRPRLHALREDGKARMGDVSRSVIAGTITLWRSDGYLPAVEGHLIAPHSADRHELETKGYTQRKAVDSWAQKVDAACGNRPRAAARSQSRPREPTVPEDAAAPLNQSDRQTRSSSRRGGSESDRGAPDPSTVELAARPSDTRKDSLKPKGRSNASETRLQGLSEKNALRPPRSASGSSRSQSQVSLPKVEDHKPPKDTSNTIGVTSFGGRAKHYSASEYAKTLPIFEGSFNINQIDLWMLDRNATCHSFSPTALLNHVSTQNKMWLDKMKKQFKVYEEMTSFYLPPAWADKAPVELSSPEFITLFEEFLSPDAKQRRQIDVDMGRIAPVQMIKADDSWHTDCLTNCLPIGFSSLRLMQEYKRIRLIHTVDETAWRSGWDLLTSAVILHLTGGDHAAVWPLLECTLRLPVIDTSVTYPGRTLRRTETARISDFRDSISDDLRLERKIANDRALAIEEKHSSLEGGTPSSARAAADAAAWSQVAEQASDVASFELFNQWRIRRGSLRMQDIVKLEPRTAKCDGLGVVLIHDFFTEFDDKWVNSFALVGMNKPRVKGLQTEVDISAHRNVDPPPLDPTAPFDPTSLARGMHISRGPTTSTARTDVTYSAVLRTAAHSEPAQDTLPSDAPPSPAAEGADLAETLEKLRIDVDDDQDDDQDDDEEAIVPDKGTLLIPYLAQQYKKTLDGPGSAAANQCRLDLVAIVKFLAKFGITDFVVFGLITEGSVGVVVCAWGEEIAGGDDIRVRIVDRNARAMDLSTVEGMLNYTSFIAKLHHDHAPKLVELFKQKNIRAEMQTKMQAESQDGTGRLRWNMKQATAKA